MEEHNSAVVSRAVEQIWNRGDLDLADSLFAATYVNHGGLIPDLVRGPEAIKMCVALFRTAFPMLCVSIDCLTTQGDTVEVQWTANGNSGQWRETKQCDNQDGKLHGTTLTSLVGGKIVESWTTWDQASALQRLTTIPIEARA